MNYCDVKQVFDLDRTILGIENAILTKNFRTADVLPYFYLNVAYSDLLLMVSDDDGFMKKFYKINPKKCYQWTCIFTRILTFDKFNRIGFLSSITEQEVNKNDELNIIALKILERVFQYPCIPRKSLHLL